MMEQLQIAALTGLVSIAHPASYLAFLEPMMWTVLSFPSFFEEHTIKPFTGRGLLDFTQRAITIGTYPSNLIFMPLAIGVMLAALLGLFRLAVQFIRNRFGETGRERFIYMTIRLVIFLQPAMTAFGGYALARAYGKGLGLDDNLGGVIIGFILAILFGLLVPILAFLWLRNTFAKSRKTFFESSFRRKFGLLYEQYVDSRFWFGGLALAKRGMLGLLIGILAIPGLQIGTIVAPMFVLLVYIAACALMRPFLDPIMLVAEIIVTVLNFITFGIEFFFLFPYGMGSNVVAIILISCTGASFLLSLGMWGVYVYRSLTVSQKGPSGGDYYEMK